MALTDDEGRRLAQTVEVLDTPVKRSRGLLKFKEAPKDYAAIFYLPVWGFFPVVHTLGMSFSIDIGFLDSQKKLRALYRDVRPGRVRAPLRYLLGGCPYMVEFSRCDLGGLQEGASFRWEASA